MNIYFTAAIAQKKDLGNYYKRIIEILTREGHKVIQDTTTTTFEEAYNKDDEQRVNYYKKILNWVNKSDLVVAEISFPSTANIGHEISLAIEKGKPVIALYFKEREPGLFLGLKTDKIIWVKYSERDLVNTLKYSLDEAKNQMDVRFNFFISPKIGAYLDWISKNRKLPRAVYLRKLIEEDMAKGDYESEKVKNKMKGKKR